MSQHQNIVCITQARTTSSRLPDKVMLEVAGKPLLTHHLERLLRCETVSEVVLATTINSSDDKVALLGEQLGVRVVRGSEVDVLGRFVLAAQASDADIVVRVTSDCPLIDPSLVDQVVRAFIYGVSTDYAHLDMNHYSRGLDTEVFPRILLDQANQDPATTAFEREHVTPYIYNRPELYSIRAIGFQLNENKIQTWRWCVDEPADFELIQRIMEELIPKNPHFTWRDCAALMMQHPDWSQLNKHIQQKGANL